MWEAIQSQEAEKDHSLQCAPLHWAQMAIEQGGSAPTLPDLYEEAQAQFYVGISSSECLTQMGTAPVWSSLLRYAFQSVDQEHTWP